ncbi:sel1 repeat-containing protein [Cystoisospora suis]|uniref:Sel1 repeat-containing protein n=1 Tax=Cystoisospora suis TaxID=483139 RepID=A0A2C6L9B3_9APIC|nr:sel1 repeat-containing protein [Cystoisospora suis]
MPDIHGPTPLPAVHARDPPEFLNVDSRRVQQLTEALEHKYGENGRAVDARKATDLLQEVAGGGRDAATAQALYELGDLQIRGYPGRLGSISRDLDAAVRYFRESAIFGYGPALHALGTSYAIGIGSLEVNEAEAIRLHHLASLTDYVPAVLAMGFRFLHGDGIPADCEAALRYYKFAAERAVQLLTSSGQAYGPPVPLGDGDRLTDATDAQWKDLQDFQRQQKDVMQYWEQQAKDGNPMAQYEFAKLQEQQLAGEGSPHASVEGGVAEKQRQVAQLYKASAEQGLAPALRDLGLLYLQGVGVEPSFEKAVQCFSQAAQLGDPESQNYLGYLYYFGASVPSPDSDEPDPRAENAVSKHSSPPVRSPDYSRPGGPRDLPAVQPRGQRGASSCSRRSHPSEHPPFASPSLPHRHEQEREGAPLSHGCAQYGDKTSREFSIPKNEVLALHYFTQAALREFPEALFFLGEMEIEAYSATLGGRQRSSGVFSRWGGSKETGEAEKAWASARNFTGDGDEARLRRALRYYQRAADGGYLLAGWREGQMLEAGKGVPERSCQDAALAYKFVAEAGPWLDDVRRGLTQYVEKDLEGALLTFAFAAEEGYEIGQANAAFLYERFRPSWAPRQSVSRFWGGGSTAAQTSNSASSFSRPASEKREAGENGGPLEHKQAADAGYNRVRRDRAAAYETFQGGDDREEGDGPSGRLPQVYRMWNRAALQGNSAALREISKFHLKEKHSDALIAGAPELALQVLKVALSQGDVKALPVLASLYEMADIRSPRQYKRAIDALRFYSETEQANASAGPQQLFRSGGSVWRGWRDALHPHLTRLAVAARIAKLKLKEILTSSVPHGASYKFRRWWKRRRGT